MTDSLPAGPLLALDTSTEVGSVAVGRGDGILAEISLRVGAGHSSALLPAVDEAMRLAGVGPGDLAGVVVGAGPGSFTGLRVAAATAKGIVHARGIPLFARSTLEVIAAGCAGSAGRVCALIDARRGDVFAACYEFAARGSRLAARDGGVGVVLEPCVRPLGEVLRDLSGSADLLFTGPGAERHRQQIEAAGGRVAPAHLHAPRAGALLWLVREVPGRAAVADPARWEPTYLRASGAERMRAAAGSGE